MDKCWPTAAYELGVVDSEAASIVGVRRQSVERGEVVAEGPPNPHDILRLKGIEELARYVVNEVQEVYRLQGVKINDKHIEVIVRQMLRKVEIQEWVIPLMSKANRLSLVVSREINEQLVAAGKISAQYERTLLGITESVSGDGFVCISGIVPRNHACSDRSGSDGQI